MGVISEEFFPTPYSVVMYNWAKDNNCLDYKIRVQYRDEGGSYYGSDKEVLLAIYKEDKIIKL